MSLIADMAACWRQPRAVLARRFAQGQREDNAIMVLMLGALMSFVAQMPAIARIAHLQDRDLNTDLAAAALGALMVLPLMFYALAALLSLVMRLIGKPIGFYGGRMALFWAYLAAAPLMLLYGLGKGFSPDSAGLVLVGMAWLAAFCVFLYAGMAEARLWVQGERHAVE